jgi:hypothetical protein
VRDRFGFEEEFMREKKGGEVGGLWLFIASLALRRGLGLREGEGIDGQGGVVCVQGFLPELDDDLIGLAHLLASVRGENGYLFGIESCWAVGQFGSEAEMFPLGPFAFSKSFSFSLFCFLLKFEFETFTKYSDLIQASFCNF